MKTKNKSSPEKKQKPSIILADPRVNKLLRDVKEGTLGLDVETLLDEIDTIHGTRIVRRLQVDSNLGKNDRNEVNKALLQNQSSRSRIVEIQSQAVRRRLLVNRRYTRTLDYVRSSYQDVLKTCGSTVNDREAMIRRIFDPVVAVLLDFESIEEYASLIITDIDQARWVLQGLRASMSEELQEHR